MKRLTALAALLALILSLCAHTVAAGLSSTDETAYAPVSIRANESLNQELVELTWLAPDPQKTHIYESFEDEAFPPAGWTEVIFYPRLPLPDILNTWSRTGTISNGNLTFPPASGSFQAGMTNGYLYRDEWLITPLFNCRANSYLSFYSHVFLGSTYEYHNYVKASTDGGTTWTVLWDAAAETGGWRDPDLPISIDLSSFAGSQLKIAFHTLTDQPEGGYCHPWFIDCIYIGTAGDPDKAATLLSRTNSHKNTRALSGYLVYRLKYNQEQNEADWVSLNAEPIPSLTIVDTDWDSLPYGDYRWAVKAVYSNGVTTIPIFSNAINKGLPMGTITGTVTNEDGEPIAGATLTNTANNYTTTTTTNSEGNYSLDVTTGILGLRVSAPRYETIFKTNILIYRNHTTLVNAVLPKDTDNDNPQTPEAVTALNGNYPNPFNPETTISYSVKDPGQVKLQIYNIKGQLVRTLVDADHATGHYKQLFDARDDSGRSLSSGVYLLRMQAPGYRKSTKMVLMQ